MTPQLRFPQFTDEWQVKKLGSFSKTFSGGTPTSTNPSFYNGNIPFIKSGEIAKNKTSQNISEEALKKSSAKMVESGDILYALYGATSGQVAISQMNGAINQAILCIRPDANRYFIYSKLAADKNTILETYLQGGQGNLSADIIKKLAIATPSKPEQEKIADFLTAVDERIAVGEKKLELLETYKRGVMQKIFTRAVRFKDENGSSYPDWEEKRLGDVADFVNGYTFLSSTYVEGGKYKVITIANVQQGAMNADSANTIDLLPANIQTSQILHLGDILISMTGNVGRVCMVDAEDCLLNQRVGKLVPRDINKDYLYQSINTPRFVSKMISSGQGGAQDNLSSKDIKGYDIALPTPEEQQKIATFLTALDDKIAAEQTRLTAAKQWRRGLLQKMFE